MSCGLSCALRMLLAFLFHETKQTTRTERGMDYLMYPSMNLELWDRGSMLEEHFWEQVARSIHISKNWNMTVDF
jgi:hypothetical protein